MNPIDQSKPNKENEMDNEAKDKKGYIDAGRIYTTRGNGVLNNKVDCSITELNKLEGK